MDLSAEEQRIIDDAKYLLMACGCSEPFAHRYIVRQAMNRRITKLAVSRLIIEKGGML